MPLGCVPASKGVAAGRTACQRAARVLRYATALRVTPRPSPPLRQQIWALRPGLDGGVPARPRRLTGRGELPASAPGAGPDPPPRRCSRQPQWNAEFGAGAASDDVLTKPTGGSLFTWPQGSLFQLPFPSVPRVRAWLTARPETQKTVILEGLLRWTLTGCPSGGPAVEERLYGAEPPPDLGRWCLDQALVATGPGASERAGYLLRRAVRTLADGVGDAGLSHELMRERTSRHELGRCLEGMLSSPVDPARSGTPARLGRAGPEPAAASTAGSSTAGSDAEREPVPARVAASSGRRVVRAPARDRGGRPPDTVVQSARPRHRTGRRRAGRPARRADACGRVGRRGRRPTHAVVGGWSGGVTGAVERTDRRVRTRPGGSRPATGGVLRHRSGTSFVSRHEGARAGLADSVCWDRSSAPVCRTAPLAGPSIWRLRSLSTR